MMSERIKMQGRKVAKKQQLKKLELKADTLISSVRNYIDPFEEWLELDSAHALNAMVELNTTIEKGKQIRDDIHRLEKELGDR